jgi:hypothetical protein
MHVKMVGVVCLCRASPCVTIVNMYAPSPFDAVLPIHLKIRIGSVMDKAIQAAKHMLNDGHALSNDDLTCILQAAFKGAQYFLSNPIHTHQHTIQANAFWNALANITITSPSAPPPPPPAAVASTSRNLLHLGWDINRYSIHSSFILSFS